MGDLEVFKHNISIHTPMKGVTQIPDELDNQPNISIHTPMKGVTKAEKERMEKLMISIHTPMKGVTFPSLWIW